MQRLEDRPRLRTEMLVSYMPTVNLPHSRHAKRLLLRPESRQVDAQLVLERPMKPRRVKPRLRRQTLRNQAIHDPARKINPSSTHDAAERLNESKKSKPGE
jgi:hypothetical protein